MKKPTVIAVADVPHIFNAACIGRLADMVELSPDLREPFAGAVHRLARVFIRDANTPNDDDTTREVKAAYAAAEAHKYAEAAKLAAGMSKPTWSFLHKRAMRLKLRLPKPSAFLDHTRRRAACEALRRITSQGGHREDGRLVPHLYLPKRQLAREERAQELIRLGVEDAIERGVTTDMASIRREVVAVVTAQMAKHAKRRGAALELRTPKRKAETDFINGLQVALYSITGVEPPVTARKAEATGASGPFVRMAQECLRLMETGKRVDAGGLLNKLRTRYPKKRASRRKGRRPCK